MKILEICLNSSLGGLELYFSWCADYFYQNQQNVIAVTLQESRLDKLLKEKNIPTAYLSPSRIWNLIPQAYRLAQLCEEHEIDLVHVHFKNDLSLVALAKKFCRRPIKIVHTRQMEMPGYKKDLYHRLIYSQVDHLLCVTDQLTKDVRERVPLPPEKISRLYYGVRAPRGDDARAGEFFKNFPSDKIKVAMFSRIEDGKGQDKLLKVLSQLHSQGVEFQVYIFGHFMTEDYRKVLQSFVESHKISSSVYWCGFQKDPVDLMPYFDIIVMPSEQETFGIVLIEAMAAKVAVMGSRAGGVPEIIDDGINGFTFAPGDLDEFADKLKSIVLDPSKRKTLAEAGHRKYIAAYSYDDHFKQLTALFHSLVKDNRL